MAEGRKVSRKLAKFVAGWEGFSSCPYWDSLGGVWTIGYGTTSADRPVSQSSPCISKRTARRWLRSRLTNTYLPAVPRRQRKEPLRQNEIDGLTSLAYNVGTGVVGDPGFSTLARRLVTAEADTYQRRKDIYREEVPKWNKSGSPLRPVLGLTKRRAAELAILLHNDYSGRP